MPTDQQYRDLAEELYGDVQIDADAVVSASDEGAYVQAWVWVSNPDPVDDDDET